MKILITGGCGFIGSNLVRLLIEQKNCQVINVDKLTYAGNPASLADLEDNPNYHFEYCDLAAPGTPLRAQRQDRTLGGPDHSSSASNDSASAQKSLTKIFDRHQPDAVMHLAAESHVDRSIDGPGEFIQTNIVGTYHLLQASLAYWRSLPEAGGSWQGAGSGEQTASLPRKENRPPTTVQKSGFRFLHVSTDEVYGSLAPEAPGFSETTPYDPHSPYSASKAGSDHLVRAWCHTYGLPVLLTNCSNNYGPYQFPEKLIPVVILQCLRGEPIPVYGQGKNIRDWLFVEDHCEALYSVLTKGRAGETYNIGGNNEQNNLNLVKKICEIIGEELSGRVVESAAKSPSTTQPLNHSTPVSYESLITFVADRPGHDMRYAIDASKICDELGWAPKEDLESGFRKTVQWYLENREWWENILTPTR